MRSKTGTAETATPCSRGTGWSFPPRFAAAPRKIHQNPAHETGGDGEKVNTVLPIHLPCIDQAQEGFMDQFRRLKRMPSALGGNVALGDSMHLVVNKRQEFVKRVLVPVAPCPEQFGDFVGATPSAR